MKTLQLIFVLLLCAFADNVGVWEECANIGVWDGCTAEAPTSWDSLLFDSTGIKLNSVEIKLTIIDTIYWHDTLILWHNEAYVDSFKIGDSNCMVINVDSLKTYVIVDSGIQSGYVNFILIDTVSSDTCNNPDSVWLESTYRPINTPPTITVQPQSDSVKSGDNVVLSVTATGSTPMTYIWQYWSGSWQDSGEAKYTNSFTVNDVNTISTYRVIVTNPFGKDTSDSAVMISFDPVVRRYSWVDSSFRAFSLSIPDSSNVGAKINKVNLTLTKWSGGQVIGTVPSGTPAGLYKSPGLWLYQYTGGDTTAIDTLGAVRVLKFQVRSVE